MLLPYLFHSHLSSDTKLLDHPTIQSAIRYPSTVSQLDVALGALALSLIGACWKSDSFIGGPTTKFGIFMAVTIHSLASAYFHRVNEKPLEKKPDPLCDDLPRKFADDFETQYKRDKHLGEIIQELQAKRNEKSQLELQRNILHQEIEEADDKKNKQIEELDAKITHDIELIGKLETLKTCIECESTLGTKKTELLEKQNEIHKMEESIEKMKLKDIDAKVEKSKCEHNILKFQELIQKIEAEEKTNAEAELESAKEEFKTPESSNICRQVAAAESRLEEIERELTRLSLSSSRPKSNVSIQIDIEKDKKEYEKLRELHYLITKRNYYLVEEESARHSKWDKYKLKEAELESDLDMLTKQINKLKEEKEKLELQALKNEKETLLRKHEQAEKRLEELKRIHGNVASCNHTKSQIQAKEEEIAEKKEKLSKILPDGKKFLFFRYGEINIEDLEKAHKKALDEMEEQQRQLNSLESLHSAINTEIISRRSLDIENYKNIRAQKKQKVSKLEEIEGLTITIRTLQKQIESNIDQPKLKREEEELPESLETKLENAKKDRDLKLKEVKGLEASISKLQQPEQPTKEDKSTKKQWVDLDGQQRQSAIESAELSLLKTRLQEVEDSIKHWKEELTKKEGEEEKTAKPLEEAHTLIVEIVALKTELSHLEKVMEKERKTLDSAQSEILAEEVTVSQLETSIEENKRKIDKPDLLDIENSEECKGLIDQKKEKEAELESIRELSKPPTETTCTFRRATLGEAEVGTGSFALNSPHIARPVIKSVFRIKSAAPLPPFRKICPLDLSETPATQSFPTVSSDWLKKYPEQREIFINEIKDLEQLKMMEEQLKIKLETLEQSILNHEAAVKAAEAADKKLQESVKAGQEKSKLDKEKGEKLIELDSLKQKLEEQKKAIQERSSRLAKAEGEVMRLDESSKKWGEKIRREDEEISRIKQKMENPERKIWNVKAQKEKEEALKKEQEIRSEIEKQLKQRQDNMEGLKAGMAFLQEHAKESFEKVQPVAEVIKENYRYNLKVKQEFEAMRPNSGGFHPDLDSVCRDRNPVAFTKSLKYVVETLSATTIRNEGNETKKKELDKINERLKIEKGNKDKLDLAIEELKEACEELEGKQGRAEEALIGYIQAQKSQEEEAVEEIFSEYLQEISQMNLSTRLDSAPLKNRYFSETETTRKTTEVVANLVTAFFFLVLPHSWFGLSETNRVIVWLLCNVIQNESHARLDKYLKENAG